MKSKDMNIQVSETMDGLVNWEASSTSDADRFAQEYSDTKGNKNLKNFDVYLKRKEIRAAAKKATKKRAPI